MAFRNLPEMPCGPILELHGQRKRFHVPYGLKRLIEEMTREVLRFQPENIYDFLAQFMEARLQRKLAEQAKNQKRKSWEQHRWSWQRGSVLEPEELKEFMESLPAPAEQVEHHAVVIQAAFRGYQARKKVKDIRKTTQLDSERRKSSIAASEARHKEEGEIDGEGGEKKKRDSLPPNNEAVTEEELHSAIVIQAAFRGMHARKEVKKLRGSVAEGKRMSEFQKKNSIEDNEQGRVEANEVAEQTPRDEVPATQGEGIEVSQTPQVEANATTNEVEEIPPSLTEPETTATELNDASPPPPVDGKDPAEVKDGDEQKPEEPKVE